MTNEQLTDRIITMVESIAVIKTNTEGLPSIKLGIEKLCLEVHDNTQHRIEMKGRIPDIDSNTKFRKNSVKVIWMACGACVTSVCALIFALIGLIR